MFDGSHFFSAGLQQRCLFESLILFLSLSVLFYCDHHYLTDRQGRLIHIMYIYIYIYIYMRR